MPIGATIGAAVITTGGGLLAAGDQKKAARTAASVEGANTDKNNALAREFYSLNTANITPWMRSGQRANNAIDELLYGPQAAQPTQSAPSAFQGAGMAQPSAFGSYASGGWNSPSFIDPGGEQFANGQPMTYGNMQYGQPQYADQGPAPAGGVTTPVSTARSAFENYLNSTGYQFRLGEGMKGLNIGFGAKGLLESGARDKAAIRYGQGMASDEFARYMDLLNRQQNLGFSGASALAGVGQNLVGNVTANNNASAAATANSALYAGQANANMWGSIAGSLGNAAGQLGSSYDIWKKQG